ncbi:MAG: hypothetical protein PUB14_03335 [Lachnospiraceae bacterium]|nr:hypothetical protein [Lachnospiraceae bacterium]
MTWVGAVAGWRESRRLIGKEMLTEQDIYFQKQRKNL